MFEYLTAAHLFRDDPSSQHGHTKTKLKWPMWRLSRPRWLPRWLPRRAPDALQPRTPLKIGATRPPLEDFQTFSDVLDMSDVSNVLGVFELVRKFLIVFERLGSEIYCGTPFKIPI